MGVGGRGCTEWGNPFSTLAYSYACEDAEILRRTRNASFLLVFVRTGSMMFHPASSVRSEVRYKQELITDVRQEDTKKATETDSDVTKS